MVVDSNLRFFEGGGESDLSLLGASISKIQNLWVAVRRGKDQIIRLQLSWFV